MALQWQAVVLLLVHGGVFVHTSPIGVEDEAQNSYYKLYRPQIQSVINELNANPDRHYNFNFNYFIDATKKTDDVTIINLEVAGECFAYHGCPNAIFICQGFVEYFATSNSYKTLPGIECQPKIRSDEGVHPEALRSIGERQVAHQLLGGDVELDTNAFGVESLIKTALHHLETEKAKKYMSIRVVRLQRQTTNVFRFTLLLEVAPTVCDAHAIETQTCPRDPDAESDLCRIVYVEKPSESSDKHIISNNCTVSQEFAAVPSAQRHRNDFDNEIDINNEYKKPAEVPEVVPESPNYEKMAETGNLEPEVISPSRLLDIEAQIIPTHPTEALQASFDQLNVETTKFGMDNAQAAVEDIPALPNMTTASTDSLCSADTSGPMVIYQPDAGDDLRENTDALKAINERFVRSTAADVSSSEESNEVKAKNNAQPAKRQTTTPDSSSSEESNEEKVNTAKQTLRRKRSIDEGDDNSSSSVESEELHSKRKTKKYQHAKYKQVERKTTKKDASSLSISPGHDDDDCKREKRDVDEYNAEHALVNDLAKFAGESLDDETWRHEVLDVVRVKKLELEGAVYHMVVRFATLKCSDLGGECFPYEHDKLCKMTIHYAQNHAKVLKSRCHQIERDIDKNRSTHSRRKRQLVGAPADATNDPAMLAFAKEALPLLDSRSSHEHKYKLVRLHSASKQVVSGVLYKLKIEIVLSDCLKNDNKDVELCGVKSDAIARMCDVHIWDRPWLPHGKETKVICDTEELKFTNRRRKREAGIPGSPSDSTQDPRMLTLATHSLLQLDSTSPHDNKYKLIQIHNASTQIVSGKLYKLTVEIVESDCPKTVDGDATRCQAKKEATTKTCDISIWERAWLPNGTETKIICEGELHTFRAKRAILWEKEGLSRESFYEFLRTYNRSYATPVEEEYRFNIFVQNMEKARQLTLNEQGTATYGASRFADLIPHEFKRFLGYRPELRQENAVPFAPAAIPDIELPVAFDWRTHGVVTHVKDQGSCGSCWAFSVTGNVEGQYAIKHGTLLEFSEQELVDCDKMDNGCDGGLMDNAYRAIEQLGGLELEKAYPYDADDEKCQFNVSLSRVQLSGALNVSSNEVDMAKFLVKNGPISIAINANAMQLYMGGVSHPLKFLCDPDSLDHGVLIVGYGVHEYKLFKKVLPYWIVKNSWGPSWGEQGYYRVYRGDGTCGVNKMASSAVVE